YSTTPMASLSNANCVAGSGGGAFSCDISGLAEATMYYARAYATNSITTSYGNEIIFTTYQSANVSVLNCSGYSLNVSTVAGVAINKGILSLPYTGGNGGVYDSQTFVSTGVSGITATLNAGTLAQGGGTINLVLSGTPQSSGNANFNIIFAGQNCNLVIPINAGVITSLNCGSAQINGTYVNGLTVSNGSIVISYTGGNGGTYNSITTISTGVTGLSASIASGNFSNGNGNLTYTISGSPSTSGNASFAISIGGQSCNIVVPIGASTIASLNCNSASIQGNYVAGLTVSSASISIPYSGGNLGPYPAQNISSTGVTGLTASLVAGNFASSGSFILTISGMPNTSGNASFAMNIGGQSCTMFVPVAASMISSLDCSSAIVEGNYVAGLTLSSASISIPYSGGNLGSYPAQNISSTGVTGLTASIPAGNFSSSGDLTFTISGTPNTNGNASFAIVIGGQSCNIVISVANSFITNLNCDGAFIEGN
ncbi:MAG: hypothetical protein ACKOW8_13585, partial [Flavobacteriales bacterium]